MLLDKNTFPFWKETLILWSDLWAIFLTTNFIAMAFNRFGELPARGRPCISAILPTTVSSRFLRRQPRCWRSLLLCSRVRPWFQKPSKWKTPSSGSCVPIQAFLQTMRLSWSTDRPFQKLTQTLLDIVYRALRIIPMSLIPISIFLRYSIPNRIKYWLRVRVGCSEPMLRGGPPILRLSRDSPIRLTSPFPTDTWSWTVSSRSTVPREN